MKNTVSIYKELVINEVTYEVGDNKVKAKCELIYEDGSLVETSFLISHSDLNRIIAKISAMGFDFNVDQINNFQFEDGTRIVEYKLENVFGQPIGVQDFEFQDSVKQIRA